MRRKSYTIATSSANDDTLHDALAYYKDEADDDYADRNPADHHLAYEHWDQKNARVDWVISHHHLKVLWKVVYGRILSKPARSTLISIL